MMATTRPGIAAVPNSSDATTGDMSAELAKVDEQVRAFVKERPILALLSAVAAGYLVGRVFRRRG